MPMDFEFLIRVHNRKFTESCGVFWEIKTIVNKPKRETVKKFEVQNWGFDLHMKTLTLRTACIPVKILTRNTDYLESRKHEEVFSI